MYLDGVDVVLNQEETSQLGSHVVDIVGNLDSGRLYDLATQGQVKLQEVPGETRSRDCWCIQGLVNITRCTAVN